MTVLNCFGAMGGPNLIDNVSTIAQAQPWQPGTEKQLMQWATEAQVRSEVHESSAWRFKALRTWTGPPLLLLCVIMAPLCSMYAGSETMKKWQMWSFFTVGVGQGLLYMCDFSGRSERHFNFASRYADMYTDIMDTLLKPFRYRPLAEVFVAKVKTTRLHLSRNEPDLAFSATHFSSRISETTSATIIG